MTAKQFIAQLFSRWEQGDAQSFFNALTDALRWAAVSDILISSAATRLAEYLEKVYRPLFNRFAGQSTV